LPAARATLGGAHPLHATCLGNLAGLSRNPGDSGRAEPLFRQALDVTRAALGEAHPVYATCLHNLAELCSDTQRLAEAFALLRQAADIDDNLIGRFFSMATDSQRAAYLCGAQYGLARLLSLTATPLVNSPQCLRAALEAVLR